jgi:hypothetical protein
LAGAGAGVVGAGVVGFAAAAGAVTVWVTAGAAAGAFTEPHAARLRPAVSAMAGIAIALLSFIVLPSRSAEKPHFTLCQKNITLRAFWDLEENT